MPCSPCRELDYTNVGFELLVDRFTRTELQLVHEAILGSLRRIAVRSAGWVGTASTGKIWWRRRESNPRPKKPAVKSLRACPVRGCRLPLQEPAK